MCGTILRLTMCRASSRQEAGDCVLCAGKETAMTLEKLGSIASLAGLLVSVIALLFQLMR